MSNRMRFTNELIKLWEFEKAFRRILFKSTTLMLTMQWKSSQKCPRWAWMQSWCGGSSEKSSVNRRSDPKTRNKKLWMWAFENQDRRCPNEWTQKCNGSEEFNGPDLLIEKGKSGAKRKLTSLRNCVCKYINRINIHSKK